MKLFPLDAWVAVAVILIVEFLVYGSSLYRACRPAASVESLCMPEASGLEAADDSQKCLVPRFWC